MFIVLAGGYSRIFGPTETTQEVRNSVGWLLGHLGFLRHCYAHARQCNKNHHNNGEFHRRPALSKWFVRAVFLFGTTLPYQQRPHSDFRGGRRLSWRPFSQPSFAECQVEQGASSPPLPSPSCLESEATFRSARQSAFVPSLRGRQPASPRRYCGVRHP